MSWGYQTQFLVAWRDSQTSDPYCLGDISEVDKHKATCFFVFGQNDASREFLIYFHLALRTNADNRRAKHIFLVIPTESFDVSAADPTSCVHVHNKPCDAPALPEVPLFRTRFTLKQPGYVLMTQVKTLKGLSKRSSGLLMSLRSLSRALSFDVYIPHTKQSEATMRNFFLRLREGPVQTPEIDRSATFHGRPCLTNDWTAYGLNDDDKLPSRLSQPVGESPPSYDEAVMLSREGHRDAATSTNEKQIVSREKGDDLVKPQGEVDEQDEPREDSDGQHCFHDDGTRRDGPQTNGVEPSVTQEDSCRKRKADDALSDAETEDGPVVVRMQKSNGEEGEVIDGDNTSEATWPHSDFESLPFKVFLQENLFISVYRSVFSTDGPNRKLFDDEKYNWFIEAVLWLRTVWYRLDNAPDVYFKELGVLSRAIRMQDRDTFERTRIQCMCDFIQEKRTSLAQGPFTLPLEDRCEWVVNFLYRRLGPHSDFLIVDDLQALNDVAMEWRRVGGDDGPRSPELKEDHTRWKLSFYTQMAACVLVALYKAEGLCHELDGTTDDVV